MNNLTQYIIEKLKLTKDLQANNLDDLTLYEGKSVYVMGLKVANTKVRGIKLYISCPDAQITTCKHTKDGYKIQAQSTSKNDYYKFHLNVYLNSNNIYESSIDDNANNDKIFLLFTSKIKFINFLNEILIPLAGSQQYPLSYPKKIEADKYLQYFDKKDVFFKINNIYTSNQVDFIKRIISELK